MLAILHTSPVSNQIPLNPDQKLVARKPRRGRETALDMVRSMAVLGVAVGFVLLVTWRPTDSIQEIRAVDVAAVVAGESSGAEFELLNPDLGEGWTATSARLEPAPNDVSKKMWHIGYVSPTKTYVGIEQSDTVIADSFIRSFVNDASVADTVTMDSLTWDVYVGNGFTALVTSGIEQTTTVVIGDTSADATAVAQKISAQL